MYFLSFPFFVSIIIITHLLWYPETRVGFKLNININIYIYIYIYIYIGTSASFDVRIIKLIISHNVQRPMYYHCIVPETIHIYLTVNNDHTHTHTHTHAVSFNLAN